MPQVAKAEVREAILVAARKILAASGYPGATLAAVADEAGTSVGNVYKYFANKDELFGAAIPARLVQETERLLGERIQSAGSERSVLDLPSGHPHRVKSQEFLTFALGHRHELVFLLSRSAGTAYALFCDDLADRAADFALRYGAGAFPGIATGKAQRRTFVRLYRGFFGQIADILAHETSASAFAQALDRLSAYHLAGLGNLFVTLEKGKAP